jgi:hypothetical protein
MDFILPENAVTDVLGYIGEVFGTFWPLISIMIGIPIAFWIVYSIINMVPQPLNENAEEELLTKRVAKIRKNRRLNSLRREYLNSEEGEY